MRQHRRFKFALYISGWTMVAVLLAIQTRAEDPAMAWRRIITSQLGCWYAWAALSPFVWWLARRFPLESPRLGRSLIVHTTATIAAALIHPCLMAVLIWIIRGFSDPLMLIASRTVHMAMWICFEDVVVYWLVLTVCHAIQYQGRLRTQELRASHLEVQLAQAQLSALKMQLHPHFLFNTLNSISALLHEDVEAADRMVARLGDFLRLTLEHSENQEVTLEQELEFLRC